MDSVSLWFQSHLPIVFFFYGFAFTIMGIAILTQPKEKSEFKLAGILWLLALFGLTHGMNEFLDMWGIVKGRNPVLDTLRWFMLVISYFFLFEFGRRLFSLSRKKIARFFGWWLSFLIVFLVFIFGFISADLQKIGGIYARYLLGFPGGFLTALGFFLYYKSETERLKVFKLKKYFLAAGLSFLAYSILGGLIVPKSNFFPAIWLNNDSFYAAVKIPVQVFRSICAIIATIGVLGVLKIFNRETTALLRDALIIKDKVTEGIDEGLMLLDTNFKILWANKKIFNHSGLKIGEVFGNYCYKITHQTDKPCQPPHDICPVIEAMKTGKSTSVLHTHFDKEGKPFYAEVLAYPIRDSKGEIIQFIHVSRNVTERIEMIEELKSARAKLEEYSRTLEKRVAERTRDLTESMADADSRRQAILNMLEDINAAHQELTKINQELKTAQAQLVQGAKMAAIGQLAGGVAHEINNPLTGVLNNVQLIKMELALKKEYSVADFKELLDVIEESGQRCKRIVTTLLDFSRAGSGLHKPINVTDVLDKAVALAENEIRFGNIKLVKEYAAGLPQIKGDANQLQQVFLNMLNNAKWALRQTAQAEIRLSAGLSSDSSSVVAEVSDNGCGIEKKDLSRIFEPFFTTKKPGEGTGLGLSVSYGIIKEHNGSVEVESKGKDKGATFRIILPVI